MLASELAALRLQRDWLQGELERERGSQVASKSRMCSHQRLPVVSSVISPHTPSLHSRSLRQPACSIASCSASSTTCRPLSRPNHRQSIILRCAGADPLRPTKPDLGARDPPVRAASGSTKARGRFAQSTRHGAQSKYARLHGARATAGRGNCSALPPLGRPSAPHLYHPVHTWGCAPRKNLECAAAHAHADTHSHAHSHAHSCGVWARAFRERGTTCARGTLSLAVSGRVRHTLLFCGSTRARRRGLRRQSSASRSGRRKCRF